MQDQDPVKGIRKRVSPGPCVTYTALKDHRVYERAPQLEPTPAQIHHAAEAVTRVQEDLPARVKRKLKERFRAKGHYVNTVSFYPFPVLISSTHAVGNWRGWAEAYADILSKVARRYRSPEGRPLRRCLAAAFTCHLPPHLRELIETYRTADDLAGAHLGDDNLGGRSIEWNLGAVGGLDEGFLVSLEVARLRPRAVQRLRPVETFPYGAVKDALHYAYACHCRANERNPHPRPLIAVVEHDDIYGSTASMAEHLSGFGEKVHLCFDRELRYRHGRLFTAKGEQVEMLYLDCHLEELPEGHPILQALAQNRVALDGSPLARLVLRSKVLLALLLDRRFQDLAGLDPKERRNIRRFLMPTDLWRGRTLRTQGQGMGKALRALCRNPRLLGILGPEGLSAGDAQGFAPLAIKVGMGPVYGGNGVAVVEETGGGVRAGAAARLVEEVVRDLARHSRPLPLVRLSHSLQAPLKGWAKEIFLEALTWDLGLSGGAGNFRQAAEAWWLDVCREVQSCSQAPAKVWEGRLTELLRITEDRTDLDRQEIERLGASLGGKMAAPLLRLLHRAPGGGKDAKTAHAFFQILSRTAGLSRFPARARLFGQMIAQIRRSLAGKRSITHADLCEKIFSTADEFLSRTLGFRPAETSRSKLQDLLLPPFLYAQARAVNPVVIQPYEAPPLLRGESGLHVTTRTHVLMGPKGPVSFVSGAQVFFLDQGIPVNRYKMTASLWTRDKDK